MSISPMVFPWRKAACSLILQSTERTSVMYVHTALTPIRRALVVSDILIPWWPTKSTWFYLWIILMNLSYAQVLGPNPCQWIRETKWDPCRWKPESKQSRSYTLLLESCRMAVSALVPLVLTNNNFLLSSISSIKVLVCPTNLLLQTGPLYRIGTQNLVIITFPCL